MAQVVKRVIRVLPNQRATPVKVSPAQPVARRKVNTSVAASARHVAPSSQTFVGRLTNKNLSTTRINVEKFGTLADAKLTDRDVAGLRNIKERFGGRTFQRQDMDAGLLRRLGERGRLEFVDGDLAALTARFKLTKAGISAAV